MALKSRVSPWWLHSKATAVGRSSLCLSSSKLHKRTLYRLSVRIQLSNEICAVRHRWDEAEYLSFESDRWCSLKKESRAEEPFCPDSVRERKKDRDIKNTRHHTFRGNTHLKHLLWSLKKSRQRKSKQFSCEETVRCVFLDTHTHTHTFSL